MAWSDKQKRWAKEMARDHFYAGESVSELDIETLLFGDTDAERKDVAVQYAKDVIKVKRLARKAILNAEIDVLDAEVADVPVD
jgi:hypothetical protein